MFLKSTHLLFAGIITTFCLIGCGKQNADYSYSAPVFPETEAVTVIPITVDEPIPTLVNMAVNDTVAYIMGNVDQKWIHKYSLNSGEHLGSYVNRGGAPDEMLMSNSIQINAADSMIYMYNGVEGDYKLYSYHIDRDGSITWVGSRDMKKIFHGCYRVYVLPQPGRLLIDAIDPADFSLDVKMISSDTIAGPSYQNLDGEPGEILRIMNSRQFCNAVSPDGKKAVYGSSFGGIMQLLDISGEKIVPIRTMRYFPQRFKEKEGRIVFERPKTLGFIGMGADENYIYASFVGRPGENVFIAATNIGVWDWNGNPVKLYTTDKSVLKIVPSNDGNELYVITYTDEEGCQIGKISLHNS